MTMPTVSVRLPGGALHGSQDVSEAPIEVTIHEVSIREHVTVFNAWGRDPVSTFFVRVDGKEIGYPYKTYREAARAANVSFQAIEAVNGMGSCVWETRTCDRMYKEGPFI